MKKVNIQTAEDTYVLSEGEIAVIHALCFYAPDGMTKKANRVMIKLEKEFRMHNAIDNYEVWK